MVLVAKNLLYKQIKLIHIKAFRVEKILNIAQKLGFGLFTIVILNILSGVFFGKIFFSIFVSFWIFTIGLALVVYPAVLNKRNED